MQLTSFLLMAMAFVTANAQMNYYPGLEIRSRTAARKGNSTSSAGGAVKSNSTAPGGSGSGSHGGGGSHGGAGAGSESSAGPVVGPGNGAGAGAGTGTSSGPGAGQGPSSGGAPSAPAQSTGQGRYALATGSMVTVAGLGVAFTLFM